MHRSFRKDEQGVSVIVGAMLLILITLAAAASLAVIVSQAEKKAANLQAYQSMVADEKLVITGITPELNSTIDKSSLNSLFITVQNLNTNISQLTTIIVNGRPCDSFSLVSANSINNPGWSTNSAYKYNLNKNYIIPAQATVVFNINFTDISDPLVVHDYNGGYAVRINKSITINIMTPYNVFDRTFNSPNAVANVKIQTQDLGNFKRDYLYLDGTGSTSDNSIVKWQWNVFNASNYDNLTQYSGQTSSAYLNFSGPFRVNLTVTDSNHLTSTSDDIFIPADDAFAPPSRIFWQQNPDNTNNYTITIKGIEGNPINNVLINMIPHDQLGNLSLDRTYGYTDNNGTFNFMVLSGSGTYIISAGNSGSLTTVIPLSYTLQKPVANFKADSTSGYIPFYVQFTDMSANDPISWQWDFGDGGTSTIRNPVHTYNALGNYTVSLTSTNVAGSNTTVKKNYITADTSSVVPSAQFTANSTIGPEPLCIQFTDQSTGYPLFWSWDFGDGGNSTIKNPVYTYAAAGTYTVKLTVTNFAGSNPITKTNYITCSPPVPPVAPLAQFTANKTGGSSPLCIQFNDTSTGTPPFTYQWEFGDGGTSTIKNPVYTYSTAGTYTVILTVTNIAGSNTKTEPSRITVS